MGDQELVVRFRHPIGGVGRRLSAAGRRGLPRGSGRHRHGEPGHEGDERQTSYLELFHKSDKVSYIPRMAVDPEFLEILACPNCKTPVTLVKDGAALKCGTCKRVYPIKDDIPVMLIDEATIEE